jgi:hypothetical protein
MANKSSEKMGNSRPFRNYLTRFDLIPSIISFSREKRERNITRWKLRHAIQVSISFSFLFLENLFGENEPNFITLILEIPFRSRFWSRSTYSRFFPRGPKWRRTFCISKFIDRIVADFLAYSAFFCLVLEIDRLQITTECQLPQPNFWSALSISNFLK